jgi:hypothetical protein
MPNKTFIKRIKEDDKYDFFDLHSELESIRDLEFQRFHNSDDINDLLKRVYSYKDFDKISSYFSKRGKERYISQIINNSNCKTMLSNFVECKGLTIDNRLVKALYSQMNINTKLEIISMIDLASACLTYNVSEPNIKMLEKCLNDKLENMLESKFDLSNYYGTISVKSALSFLVKTSGFIPESSFNKKYIFEMIDKRKSFLNDLITGGRNGRQIDWIKSNILILDCLKSYFDQETSFDKSMFVNNSRIRYHSRARCKLYAFIFADSCSIKKDSSHEFIKENKMNYETRCLFYDYRVRLGKANPKLSRIARSDGSEESCKSFVIALLASLKMYSDDEILALVAQFTDCKYYEPSVILYRGLPQKYKYLMLSNKHVRRSGR